MFKVFRQPYLSENTGASEAGAATQTETQENNLQSAENTEQSTTATTENQQITEQPKIKVKYNHQEIELPYEEAVAHIQKGMNYEKAVERAKQEAAQESRDKQIAELAKAHGWVDYSGNPITTEAQYQQALRDQDVETKIRQKYSDIPDELVQEILESKRDREERAKEKQNFEQEQRRQTELKEFLDVYKKKTGKMFDTDTDTLPKEVIDMANGGKTLADAYLIWYGDSKDARIAELEARLKAIETNTQNANSSPGSVTGNGNIAADFISSEVYETNKKDPNWVKQNFKKIMESRASW
jgi:hypothetical protein